MKFSVSLLEVWLRSHMSTSCHGINSLPSGNRDSSTVVYKPDGRGRVFSNTQLSPCRYLQYLCKIVRSLFVIMYCSYSILNLFSNLLAITYKVS